MRRRKHTIDVKTGAVDWTTIPVTNIDLIAEWYARKNGGYKRCFVSFLRKDTEYIYAFRFLKADIQNKEPVAQLALIRTKDAVYVNRKMNYNYLCGYLMDFDGGIRDFHQPKSKAFDIKYAIPTLMDKVFESDKAKNRPTPTVLTSVNKKYGFGTIASLKYLPENAFDKISQDATYYLGYIMESEDTIYIAEMLSKLGHPECLTDSRWFGLEKKDLIQMIRYAQKANMQTWNYNTIAYNLKRNPPEKAIGREEIMDLGRVKNAIKWAKKVSDQKEIIRYLKKQKETLHTYEDYFRMRDELQLDYESHSARFPSSLTMAHQELTREVERLENAKREEEERQDNATLESIADKVAIKSDKYIPLIPKSKADFRYYGKAMDDCLGCDYWAKDVIQGKCFIFLLGKEKNGAAVPYMACEVRRAKKELIIKQLYLQHNEVPSKSERRYVTNKILPQLEEQVL